MSVEITAGMDKTNTLGNLLNAQIGERFPMKHDQKPKDTNYSGRTLLLKLPLSRYTDTNNSYIDTFGCYVLNAKYLRI